MSATPPRWSKEEFEADRDQAIEAFREQRMGEPLELYLDAFDTYREAVETLLETTVDLSRLSDAAIDVLTDPELLIAVRYLAGPPISADDLKTVAEASLAPSRLRADPVMARRVIDTVLLGLDRNRFLWISEDREPTEEERAAAAMASAALIASQRVQTARRNESKDEQEAAVAERLRDDNHLDEVGTRVIRTLSDAPGLGEFCRESQFGERKADLIVRLWDNRVMPIECKVSNSSVNSVKRLNNDAAAKAPVWLRDFGAAQTVPAAVLAGVYERHNLEQAQENGMAIFWAHDLDKLVGWIESTRP